MRSPSSVTVCAGGIGAGDQRQRSGAGPTAAQRSRTRDPHDANTTRPKDEMRTGTTHIIYESVTIGDGLEQKQITSSCRNKQPQYEMVLVDNTHNK